MVRSRKPGKPPGLSSIELNVRGCPEFKFRAWSLALGNFRLVSPGAISHATLVETCNTPLLQETDTLTRLGKSSSANIRREPLCRVEKFVMLPW
jgi:hypothetical protein